MFNQHRILRVFKLISLLKAFPNKSIKRLAQSLEISERSCYRYLDLLAELGFVVEKDAHNKFFIKAEDFSEPLTKEEATLIHETIAVAAKNHPLAASILSKLPYLDDLRNDLIAVIKKYTKVEDVKITSHNNQNIELLEVEVILGK